MNRPAVQRIIILIVLSPLSTLTVSSMQSGGNGAGRKAFSSRLDSLRLRSHERYYEELLRKDAQRPLDPPIQATPASPWAIPNIDVSRDTAPQNEPSVRISHKNPNRAVAAWRDFRTGSNPAVRRIGYSYTTDAGSTWGAVGLLPQIYSEKGYTRHSDPAVCVDTAGNFYIATVALNNSDGNLKLIVFKSDPNFDVFNQAYFVPTDTAPNFYDKEYIVCDLSPGSPYVNNLYMAWSGSSFSRSTNEGVTWSSSIQYGDPAIGGSFAPDICVGPDGQVYVSSHGGPGGGPIECDRSTDGGVSFDLHVRVDSMATPGAVNLPGFTSIATDLSNGPRRGSVYLVWSDTRLGDLDIFLSYSRDNGLHWSHPRRVNDDQIGNGKEQYWPWLAVDDRGVVSVVYYDTRNTSGPQYHETFLAYSWDGGITFTNRLISTAQSARNFPNAAVRFGDYIGLDSWGKHTIPVWTDERAGGYDMSIYTATLDTLPLVNFSGVSLNVSKGWNLLSLPVLPSGQQAGDVFPGALMMPLAYTTTYEMRSTVDTGLGYWVRYGSNQVLSIPGDTLASESLHVGAGWNLVGSMTNPVSTAGVTSTPPGIITSGFFGYDGSYIHAATIQPGGGYWVKSSGPGSLFLSSSPSMKSSPVLSSDDLDRLNQLTLSDESGKLGRLYFGGADQSMNLKLYELPPVPPEGSFDLRFASGRIVEIADAGGQRDIPIRLSSASYPVSVRWNANHTGVGASLIVDGSTTLLNETGRILMRREPLTMKLRLKDGVQATQLPRSFALRQNYPNPFNPDTRIVVEIPSRQEGVTAGPENVTLKVYDLLGREVATLVDGVRQPGVYRVDWNAGNFPSGIYTYRLRAGQFSDVKKMLLVK